jgi:hypothetical protein
LVATGAVLLIGSAVPRVSRLLVGRAADVAEAIALLSLLPLLVLAIGLVAAVRT